MCAFLILVTGIDDSDKLPRGRGRFSTSRLAYMSTSYYSSDELIDFTLLTLGRRLLAPHVH